MGIKGFMKSKAKDFAEQRKIRNLMSDYHSKEDLQKLAKKLHLKTSGNKGDLTKRIVGSPDFNLTVLQRTFTKAKLKKMCAELKLETTGTDTAMWNRILVKKGIIDQPELPELSDSPAEPPQVAVTKKKKVQKSPVRQRTPTSGTLKPTTAREFMRKYLSVYDFHRLVRKFKLDHMETRAQLIDQIVSHPDFELDDLKQALGKERISGICRALELRVSGAKDELWESVVEALNLEKGGKDKPPHSQSQRRVFEHLCRNT